TGHKRNHNFYITNYGQPLPSALLQNFTHCLSTTEVLILHKAAASLQSSQIWVQQIFFFGARIFPLILKTTVSLAPQAPRLLTNLSVPVATMALRCSPKP
ncbi:MAG: hypothetical protein VKK97_00305, partial [Synechococcaceae cyanobacterium]|nr:hypothetical protein [Synechococcaceae cyanobacterium]